MLAAAVLVVHVGAKAYDLVRLGMEERRLDAEITETFKVAMPGVERIVDARAQMQQRLGGVAADPEGLLVRLEGLSGAFSTVQGVRLRTLGWRERTLDIRVSAPSGEALSEISRAAGERGLSFEVQSTVPREGGVDGLVTVARAGRS